MFFFLEHGIFDDISPQSMVFDLLERDDKLTQIGGFPQHLLDPNLVDKAEQSLDSLDGKITSQLKTICCRQFFWLAMVRIYQFHTMPIQWKIWEFEIRREPCIGYSLKMSIFPPVAQE